MDHLPTVKPVFQHAPMYNWMAKLFEIGLFCSSHEGRWLDSHTREKHTAKCGSTLAAIFQKSHDKSIKLGGFVESCGKNPGMQCCQFFFN